MFRIRQYTLSLCLCLTLITIPVNADQCAAPDEDAIVPASEEDRLDLIGRARVWGAVRRSGRSLAEGPLQGDPENRFDPGQEIRCDFVEPEDMARPRGTTEKFLCKYQGRPLWLKYHTKDEYNPGVWGEVQGTRSSDNRQWPLMKPC